MTARSVVGTCSARMGLDAALNGGLVADVVGANEGCESLLPSFLGELERGPALDKIGEDGGLLVAEPLQNLGGVGLQGSREAIGDCDAVLHECAAILDEAAEGAHGSALGL